MTRYVTRTTIDIDDVACVAVMRRYGLTTKREAVNYALRELASRLTLDEARRLRGSGWDAGLDEIRGTRVGLRHRP